MIFFHLNIVDFYMFELKFVTQRCCPGHEYRAQVEYALFQV